MAAQPFESQHDLFTDLSTAYDTEQSGVSAQYARAGDQDWEQWTKFCTQIHIDPLLEEIDNPVRLLELFAIRTRDGRMSKSGGPVRTPTMDQALCSVGHGFSHMGAHDPRLDAAGNLDLRLTWLTAGKQRRDPPARHVKPIPIPILHHAVSKIMDDPNPIPALQAAANMLTIGYYFWYMSTQAYLGTAGLLAVALANPHSHVTKQNHYFALCNFLREDSGLVNLV
jgi:hypothetical protein